LCTLEPDALVLFEGAVTRGTLSARAFDRAARVSRTTADLAGPRSSPDRTSPKRWSTGWR
jgi:predicted ATPase with chaperone activity